ncbi:MAG: YHYH protein [Gammaproteobacteria bacterium]|nr:YHYH protein [Gammaproteobacteria bacterium]
MLAACQGTSSNIGQAPGIETGNPTDLSNRNLTNTSGNCQDYQGQYTATGLDKQRNIVFSADINLSAADTKCSIQSNMIPNHSFNDETAHFATNVSEQSSYVQFTSTPSFASHTTALELGQIDVMFLNGVSLDMLAAACYGVGNGEPLGRERIGCGPSDNPWRYDPMSPLNDFGTDSHNAHVQPSGAYHYHGNPMALFQTDCTLATERSPVVGFAADGFPVFGSCIKNNQGEIVAAQSSYKLKSGERSVVTGYTTPTKIGNVMSSQYNGQFRGDYIYEEGLGDLDECNGMTQDGQYGYVITNRYPWVLNCFKGEPDSSFNSNGGSNARHAH